MKGRRAMCLACFIDLAIRSWCFSQTPVVHRATILFLGEIPTDKDSKSEYLGSVFLTQKGQGFLDFLFFFFCNMLF